MRFVKWVLSLTLALCWAVSSALAVGPTTVSGILYLADGVTTYNGVVHISWTTTFTSADGHVNYTGNYYSTVTAGVLSVNLEPNDTANPSNTFYIVDYNLTAGIKTPEIWVVPTSASPVGLGAVRSPSAPTPGVSVALTQIQLGGASVGQCLTATSTVWLPASSCWLVSGNNITNPNSGTVNITTSVGPTGLVITGGSSQGTTNLLLVQPYSGVINSGIGADSSIWTSNSGRKIALLSSSALLSSDSNIAFKNVTNIDSAGAYDTGLARNSAGVLEVNNGIINTLRDVTFRKGTTTGIFGINVPVTAKTTAVTLTAAEMMNGIINGTPVANTNYQSATAATIVAAIPNCVVGTTYSMIIRNMSAGAFTLTLTTNTGITISGTASVAQNFTRTFIIRVTTCTAASEAVTIYGLVEASGGGGGSGCVPIGTSTHILLDDGAGACTTSGVAIDGSNNVTGIAKLSTGGSSPACAGGTAGGLCMAEGTAITAEASVCILQALASTHRVQASCNGGGFVNVVTASSTDTLTNKSLAEASLTFTNITTGDCNASTHGFTPKDPNDITYFLSGDCTWRLPPGGTGATLTAGPYEPFGLGAGTTALLAGDGAAGQVIVDQFVATFNGTFATDTIYVGSSMGAGKALIVGYYDAACTTLMAFARSVNPTSSQTLSLTLSTPLVLVGGTLYHRAISAEAEFTPTAMAAVGGAGYLLYKSGNNAHFVATNTASGTNTTYVFPATCGTPGGLSYYATVQNVLRP